MYSIQRRKEQLNFSLVSQNLKIHFTFPPPLPSLSIQWLVQELNTFYLKAILWIPINHELNLYRLIIYAPSGAVALREVYDYFNSR